MRARASIAVLCAAALVGTLVGTAGPAAPAAAEPAPAAPTATSRFLAGSLLASGVDLDRVVSLAGVTASPTAASAVRTVAGPLGLRALSALTATLPGGLHLPLSQFVRLGAVNQFARAGADGVSRAAAGAVGDSGAVDTSGTGAYPADATVDLAGLLGPAVRAVLSRATLTLGGVTAVAAVDQRHGGTPASSCADLTRPDRCRDYTLARGRLTLASPAVATLVRTVTGALDTLTGTLDSALRSTLVQQVLTTVAGLITTLNTLLGGLGVLTNTLAVTVSADLRSAVSGLLRSTLSDGVVTLDLSTGAIGVDVSALAGGLDDLAPGTDVLGAGALTRVVAHLADLLAGLQQQLLRAVTRALDAVSVGLSGGICLLKVLGACTAGLSVRFSGPLGSLVSGSTPLTVSGTGLLSLTGPALTTVLSTLRSALAAATGTLTGSARASATAAATGAATALRGALDPALRTLGSLVRVTANVQEPGRTPGSYREVAARLLLGSGGVAALDLARVEVAPGVPPRTSTAAAPGTPGRTTVVPGRTVVVPGRPGSTVVVPGSTPAAASSADLSPVAGSDRSVGAQSESRSPALPWTALGALLLALAALVAAIASRLLRRGRRDAARS